MIAVRAYYTDCSELADVLSTVRTTVTCYQTVTSIEYQLPTKSLRL